MIDFVGKRYWYFLLSALIIVPGALSLLIPPGLRMGVDFIGGTLWRMRFQSEVRTVEVQAIFAQHGHPDAIIQISEGNTLIVRTKEITADSPVKAEIGAALRESVGPFEEESFDSVGPAIAAEIGQQAAMAVGMAAIGIMLYITFAFRRVPSPFRYGTCALAALLHDALVVLGIFSIMGRLLGTEISAAFVTAVLTVLGYSVHDTIVVFDRIRENIGRYGAEAFEPVVNHSLMQTLVRSLNTALTTLFTLTALFLFGGVTTRDFALALLLGIASGTYSSIFNASQLLVVWENGELRLLFRRWAARKPAKA